MPMVCMLVKLADTYMHAYISKHICRCFRVSSVTGKERSVSTKSIVLAYTHFTKHHISASDFKILSSGTSERSRDALNIRESLLISKINPVLNSY